MATGGTAGGKSIIVLADGTGNSAGKLARTNVWRLYQALDLTPAASPPQIAYYHDGVGTSAFKPLAILGGAFGYGLKRNLLDLYSFLCRNYEKGDRIYAFGFSRGAFTIRILIGLVLTQGLYRCASEAELARVVSDRYRAYRATTFERRPIVTRIGRFVRNLFLSARRTKPGADCRYLAPSDVDVHFVGVWDTVAAYGLPLDELTRAIDKWIWPLSMPNYRLSPRVRRARHALSLDDERNTFHPLLWNEAHQTPKEVLEGRLRQVWFAGVHSDVGGGYAVDNLAALTLYWMMDEAGEQATQAGLTGLRFTPRALEEAKAAIDASAPLHDSRRGLGGYYRYQPRKIEAFREPPAERTLIMRNPDRNNRGFLTSVNIHASVFERIRSGADHYSPIVIPDKYNVVGPGCADLCTEQDNETNAKLRADQQEWVWNDVWRKRINYFFTVFVSFLLALMPLLGTDTTCSGLFCLLSPLITGAGALVPAFADAWIEAFAAWPGIFAGLVTSLVLLLLYGAKLQTRIHDGMRTLWENSLIGMTPASQVPPQQQALPGDGVYRLRTCPAYLHVWQWIKWQGLPCLFARSAQLTLFLGVLAAIWLPLNRLLISFEEQRNEPCSAAATATYDKKVFDTRYHCWPVPGDNAKGSGRYRIVMTVREPWFDDDRRIETNPMGFGSERFERWWSRWTAWTLRRAMTGKWFQPLLRTVAVNGAVATHPLDMQPSDDHAPDADGSVYSTEIDLDDPRDFYLYVNDALVISPRLGPFPWLGTFTMPPDFYKNNSGKAEVRIEFIPPPRKAQ